MPARLHCRQNRGRRVLLWAAGFFFLFQFGAGLLLDYTWPEFRFPSTALIHRALATNPNSPDLIFFGSSRFGMGILPGHVNQSFQEHGQGKPVHAFNASIGHGDLVTAEYIFRELSHHGPHPAQVVVEVSPETVTRFNRWVLVHLQRQLTWKDLPHFLADVFKEGQLGNLLKSRFLPLFMHRGAILKKTAEAIETFCTYQDATQQDGDPGPKTGLAIKLVRAEQPAGLERTCLGMDEVPRWLRDYQAGGGNSEAALARILQRCQKRGIQVLLVGVPVASAHRRLYTPQIEAQFQSFVKRVVATYPCEFVDYRAKVPDHFFNDHHHLSPAGASFFSSLLAREVLVPRWHDHAKTIPH